METISFCHRCQTNTETVCDNSGHRNICSDCWATKESSYSHEHRLTKIANIAAKKVARQELQQAMFRVVKILTHVQHRHGKENWPTMWPMSHFSETEAWSADQIVKIARHGL